MINENAIVSAAGADQHHASSSSSSACLPPAALPHDGTGQKQQHQMPAISCTPSVCGGHAMLGNTPFAIGAVVAFVGFGILLVAALSSSSPSSTAPKPLIEPGPTPSFGTFRSTAAAPFRQSPFSSSMAGQFVGIDQQQQQQQQINALRAQLDQLQYELTGQLPYSMAEQPSTPGAHNEWPPSFFPIDYTHPKALLARRHMAWQPMRRGTENDEQHGSVSPRHISWQPMKRQQQQQTEYGIGEPQRQQYSRGVGDGGLPAATVNDGGQKEQLMRTVEQQLIEVLRAGDRLGVSTDEILAHLRAQNENGGVGGIGRR